MPKQVYDQYQSELRQGKAKPWYDFSDLPVWGGTLPGTPEDAAYISTELAKDISPVIGPYRSGVRSTQEYNKMMSLLDEGDYTGAISPGIWSLLESADAGLSSLGYLLGGPLLGGALSSPFDLARASRPIFTSPAQKAVSEVGKDALPAQQWMKQLEGRGVKKDELEWTGLQDFLKGRKGNIPKTEVEDFIEANKIDVQEVLKSSVNPYPYTTADEWSDAIERAERAGDWDEADNLNRMWESAEGLGPVGEPKFSKPDWQLPGGENYRELLLTLPVKKSAQFDPSKVKFERNRRSVTQADFKAYYDGKFLGTFDDTPELVDSGEYITKTDDEIIDQIRRRFEGSPELGIKALDEGQTFRGGHYSEPNVLAHIRFNERVDPDGKKVLFIEEIQSDWAQKGRKHGFIDESKLIKELPEGFTVREIPPDTMYYQTGTGTVLNGDLPRWQVLDQDQNPVSSASPNRDSAVNAAINHINEVKSSGDIPRAPFMEDTNQWANLSLKRMIRWAADNDFDSIAWTTGKQQAERYDLSKQISEVHYQGTDFTAFDHSGNRVIQRTGVRKEDLEDIIGKEAAKKLLEQPNIAPPTSRYQQRSLKGQDLEVGGEGMEGFYDDIVVNQAKKIGKKHGAKVEKGHADAELSRRQITKMEGEGWDGEYVLTKATTPEERWMQFDTFEEAQEYLLKTDPLDDEAGKVWKMKLTDKLKKAAKEGLPYYALVPPSLLAIGAQQERQSLLE
tara:strand:- start:43 stop:2241 length:2199 start_codon:yes stop_codon:yes gene_type:complete